MDLFLYDNGLRHKELNKQGSTHKKYTLKLISIHFSSHLSLVSSSHSVVSFFLASVN